MRRLTPIEETEYRRRCAALTEQHMAAFRLLLSELSVEIHNGTAYKVTPVRNTEDDYSIHA